MLMNLNMVKTEKFDHLHLIDHFTVPLKTGFPTKCFTLLMDAYNVIFKIHSFFLIFHKNKLYENNETEIQIILRLGSLKTK